MTFLEDEVVDSIRVFWREDQSGLYLTDTEVPEVAGDEDFAVSTFAAFLRVCEGWDTLEMLADGVVDRISTSTDDRRFAYPTQDSGEQIGTPDRIVVTNGVGDSIEVSERAFTRAMAQLFRVLVAGALHSELDIVERPGWSRFVGLVETIADRYDEPG